MLIEKNQQQTHFNRKASHITSIFARHLSEWGPKKDMLQSIFLVVMMSRTYAHHVNLFPLKSYRSRQISNQRIRLDGASPGFLWLQLILLVKTQMAVMNIKSKVTFLCHRMSRTRLWGHRYCGKRHTDDCFQCPNSVINWCDKINHN